MVVVAPGPAPVVLAVVVVVLPPPAAEAVVAAEPPAPVSDEEPPQAAATSPKVVKAMHTKFVVLFGMTKHPTRQLRDKSRS